MSNFYSLNIKRKDKLILKDYRDIQDTYVN